MRHLPDSCLTSDDIDQISHCDVGVVEVETPARIGLALRHHVGERIIRAWIVRVRVDVDFEIVVVVLSDALCGDEARGRGEGRRDVLAVHESAAGVADLGDSGPFVALLPQPPTVKAAIDITENRLARIHAMASSSFRK